jgi:hypothetical protein
MRRNARRERRIGTPAAAGASKDGRAGVAEREGAGASVR